MSSLTRATRVRVRRSRVGWPSIVGRSRTNGRTGAAPASAASKPQLPAVRRLSPAQAAWLLVQSPADLTADDRAALDQMQSVTQEISTAYTLAQDFIGLVRERAAERLTTLD